LRDPDTLLSVGTDGDGPDRSLDAVFSSSYRALSPPTATMFRLLGLLPAAEFSVEAAAALSGENVRQARQRLLDFYLHTAEHAYRAAFPHLLVPPVSPAVSGAAPMDFESERDALRWFFTERDNLTGFLDYAVRTGNHGYAWQMPHLTAAAFERFGLHRDIVIAFSRAAEAAEYEGDKLAEAVSLNDLGYFLLGQDEVEVAAAYLDRASKLMSELDFPVGLLTVKVNIAQLHRKRGNLDLATTIYRECLVTAREIEDRTRQANIEHHLGLPAVPAAIRLYTVLSALRTDLKDFGGAAQFARRAAELAKRAGKGDSEAAALDLLGNAHVQLGERRAACRVWRRASQIFLARGRQGQAAMIAERLAELCAAGPPRVPLAREPDDGSPEEISDGHPIG
jgi:tetratricopeptide (TPR) repeat protein